MFLALDESLDNNTSVIGCLCFPTNLFSNLESKATRQRAMSRLWSEMKWHRVNSTYAEKYKKFLSTYIDHPQVTFHSWAYEDLPRRERIKIHSTQEKSIIFYKHCYALIRSVIQKCHREGVNDFYILADETGRLGSEQYKIIRQYLESDRKFKFKPRLLCCMTGNSAVCNALQVTDLITGCVAQSSYAKSPLASGKQDIFEYLVQKNDGLALDLTPRLPGRLYETKFHHCNITKYKNGIIK